MFIVVGKSRSGKTFFTRALFDVYREHFSRPENMKYTFAFTNLERLGYGEKLNTVESQTFEDPMVLVMNLGASQEESIGLLRRVFGFSEKDTDDLLAKYRSWGGGADYFYWPSDYRPLGACSRFIWEQIKNFCGNIEKALDWVKVVPVMPELGKKLITFDYPKDRITSSAADIIGEESIERLVNIQCFDGRGGLAHPYAHDLQRGSVARAAGGGIHCCDEFLKTKRPVFHEYLRTIKRMGISIGSDLNFWPIDTLFLATTNDMDLFSSLFPGRKLDESQTYREMVKYIDIPSC